MSTTCTGQVLTDLVSQEMARELKEATEKNLRQVHRETFAPLSRDDLFNLRRHGDDIVSVNAGLRLLVRNTSLRFGERVATSLERKAAWRFIGHTEGRLGIAIPAVWANNFCRAKIHRTAPLRLSFPLSKITKQWILHKYINNVYGANGTTLDADDDTVWLTNWEPDVELAVERGELHEALTPGMTFDARGSGGTGIILSWNSRAGKLWRFSKGRVSWKRNVNPVWPTGASGVVTLHLEMVEADSHVYVFGMTQPEAFLYGFRKDDGSRVLLCSTALD